MAIDKCVLYGSCKCQTAGCQNQSHMRHRKARMKNEVQKKARGS